MERRLQFSDADLDYLANLCHNCGECYYACQYAPPHEFGVNVPRTLAQIRADYYRRRAWSHIYGGWMQPVLVACLIGFLQASSPTAGAGDFYSVISHRAMVAVFGVAAVLAGLMIGLGLPGGGAWLTKDALSLRN